MTDDLIPTVGIRNHSQSPNKSDSSSAQARSHVARPKFRHLRSLMRTCFPGYRAVLLAFFVCIIAPTALITVHIHENPLFSPQDEAAHYDYVNRIAMGQFPRLGQFLLPSTLRAVSCRGSALYGAVAPPCDSKVFKPADYSGGGYQYEAQQPPTYYAVTVVLRWIPLHLLHLSELTATRLTGILWLIGGLLLLWMTGSILGLTPSTIGMGILILTSAPVAIYESSIVTNGAAAIFCGSLIAFLGALAWKYRIRRAPLLLGVGAFLVATVQQTDFLPVVAVAALFGLLAITDRPTRARVALSRHGHRRLNMKWMWASLSLLFGGGIAVVSWLIIYRKLSLINPKILPSFGALRGSPVGLSLIANEALTLLAPLTDAYSPFRSSAAATPPESFTSQNLQPIFATAITYLVVAGSAAALFVRRRQWSHWLGLVSMPVLFLGGIVLGVGIWRTYAANPGLDGRYGLSVAPLLILALVGSVRSLWPRIGLWAFGLITFSLSFYFMFSS